MVFTISTQIKCNLKFFLNTTLKFSEYFFGISVLFLRVCRYEKIRILLQDNDGKTIFTLLTFLRPLSFEPECIIIS